MSVHKVVYRGLSDIREMSVKDLKAAGVHVGGDLVWDRTQPGGARPKVFIEDITDRLLEIFRQEGTFTVTEVDANTLRDEGAEPIVAGEPLDDTGTVVKDGVTGQTSEKGNPDADADPVPSGTLAGGTASASGASGGGAAGTTGKASTGRAGKGSST